MRRIRGLAVLAAFFLGLIGHAAHAELTEVTDFGSNPGRLQMFTYVPQGLRAGAPLVVMLHGCAQRASDVDDETGWTQMADTYRFAMVFPQTTFVDPLGFIPCFRAYDSGHNRRGVGEALSVKQMVDWMQRNQAVDPQRIYVSGISSGAFMTSVMMASYPDVFAAGAIFSGIPYRCVDRYIDLARCAVIGRSRTPRQWGDLVRSAYPGYRGPYPRVSIWHGTWDVVVRESNAAELVKQWTNVNGVDQTADEYNLLSGYPHAVYKTAGGEPRVEHYTLTLGGHAIQVNPVGLLHQPACGTATTVGTQLSTICQVYYTAKWFGIAR